MDFSISSTTISIFFDEAFELDDVVENPTVVEELEIVDAPYDIEHNVEFAESLLEDRPELTEMFRNGEFFEQGNNEHGFEGTCGETTQANTLNKLLGTNEITENDVLNIAIDKNLCEVDVLDPENSGGSDQGNVKKMHIKLLFFAVFSALSSHGKFAVLLGKATVFWYNGNIRNRRKKQWQTVPKISSSVS